MAAQPDLQSALLGDPVLAARLRGDRLVARVESLMVELAHTHGGAVCAALVEEHLSTGGKRLRARLALDAAEALGVPGETAVGWAAACELLHNASLVHDDLQDGDRVRRGQPALWARHGADQAINAGDLMLMLPTLALGAVPVGDDVRWRLAASVARHGARTAAGQSEELALRDRGTVDAAAYRRAVVGKTAGLFGLPVEGAALLAGAAPARAQALAEPFERLGEAFQLQDDLVDLWGDKGREAPGADLREGKISALVVAHLVRRPEDHLWLMGVLRTPRDETSAQQVDEATRRFVASGARDDVLSWTREACAAVEGPSLDGAAGLRRVGRRLRDRILCPLGRLS